MSSAVMLVMGLGACKPEQGGSRVTVRDSAGVRIVTSVPDTARSWHLSAKPTFELTSEGDSALFVLATHAQRLSDGHFIFVPRRGHEALTELLVVSAGGQLVRRIGRKGRGPGEFTDIQDLFIGSGDTLVVVDGTREVSFLDRDGTFQRRITLQADSVGFGMVHARFRDASFVGFTQAQSASGELRIRYIRVGPDGRVRNVLTPFLHYGQRVVGAMPAWSAETAEGASGSLFYHAYGSRYEVEVYDETGILRKVFRLTRDQRRSTSADIERFKNATRNAYAGSAMKPPDFSRYTFPDLLPTFSRIWPAANGSVWAREATIDPESEGLWFVFDSSGANLATVRTPPHFEVSEIGDDYVLGVAWESESSKIQCYSLAKTPDVRR